jgi:PAS domain S-box-containing protein
MEKMKLNLVRLFSRFLGAGLVFTGLGSLLTLSDWTSLLAIPRSLFALLAGGAGIYLIIFPERISLGRLKQEYKRSYLAYYSLNHGTELVWWIGRDNRILDVNDRLVSVSGFSRAELVGRSVEVIDQGWVEQRTPELWSGTAGGESFEQETLLTRRDSPPLPCSLIITHYRDADDEFLCVFAQDISVQKRVSGELQEAQALFEGFLSGLPVGAFVRNQEHRFLYCNRQFGQWNPEVAVGRTVFETSSPAMARMIEDEDRRILDEGAQIFYHERVENLETRTFEVHMFPLRLPGRGTLVGGIVSDTTSRHRTDLKMQESKAFLEAVINQSPVGIIILDANTTNIIICNDGAKNLLGLEPSVNLTGRTVSHDGLIWEVLNADGTPPPLEQNPLYKAFFHQTTTNDKMILRLTDGQEKFVLINSGPIYDARGRFIAAIVAFLDVTELRNTQDRLEELNHSLEEMVSARTRELSQSNEALKVTIDNLRITQDQLIESEKLASLGSLVAGVAHEINTPVGVGVTAASFLTEKTEALDQLYQTGTMRKSDLETYLQNARQSSSILLSNLERASHLIKSFKMISVYQSTDLIRRFKLKEYFEQLFLSLHSPDKRIKIEVVLEGDADLEIRSFPGTFSQVATNLFMNSCHHGFEGRSDGRVTVRFWTAAARLFIRYGDNGKGMDEGTLKRIYEPFFTTRRDLGGSGLGMNIVFNLVNQKLGGTIKASSVVDEGTEFLLDLPLDPPESVEKSSP